MSFGKRLKHFFGDVVVLMATMVAAVPGWEVSGLLSWADSTISALHAGNYQASITITPKQIQKNPLGRILQESKSVCFLGDSITAGSDNGGFPWYLPLVAAFPHLDVANLAHGGATSKSTLERSIPHVKNCDVYVIALGTNDVRYRDADKGAVTAEEYIENISCIVQACLSHNPAARFVFIAPWCSIPGDPIPPISRAEKEYLMSQYAQQLKDFSSQMGAIYIDPTNILRAVVYHESLSSHFLKDHIHPLYPGGCLLYSSAEWEAAFPTQN